MLGRCVCPTVPIQRSAGTQGTTMALKEPRVRIAWMYDAKRADMPARLCPPGPTG